MNRLAEPQTSPSPVAALACLDLSVEHECQLYGASERMHNPKDAPYWRMLNLKRVGDTLYELAEYMGGAGAVRRFEVLTWTADASHIGVRFQRRRLTHRGALRVFVQRVRDAEASLPAKS